MYLLYQSRGGLANEALVGRVTYAGELAEFVPFVALGAFLHVGKNATFGLGRYEILHRVDTSNEGRTIKKC